MTLWEELGLAELIIGDLGTLAAGQPVATSQRIGSATVNIQVTMLPNGTAGTNYETFSGAFLPILLLALRDAAKLAAGQALDIAEKIGNTWYGYSFTLTPG